MAGTCLNSAIAVYRICSVVLTLMKLKPQGEKRKHTKNPRLTFFLSCLLSALTRFGFFDTINAEKGCDGPTVTKSKFTVKRLIWSQWDADRILLLDVSCIYVSPTEDREECWTEKGRIHLRERRENTEADKKQDPDINWAAVGQHLEGKKVNSGRISWNQKKDSRKGISKGCGQKVGSFHALVLAGLKQHPRESGKENRILLLLHGVTVFLQNSLKTRWRERLIKAICSLCPCTGKAKDKVDSPMLKDVLCLLKAFFYEHFFPYICAFLPWKERKRCLLQLQNLQKCSSRGI